LLTLADIIEAITDVRPEQADMVITEAAIDSRQVIPGGLFVALPGEHTDGHNFVQHAFSRGASFALVQQEPTEEMPTLDLRSESLAKIDESALHSHLDQLLAGLEGPFCLRVDDSLKALQQAARFWRRKLDVQVIGITGSVGKSTTKELVAEVLGQRYKTLKNVGNFNNEIGLPLSLLSLSPGHERAVLEMGFYVPGEIAFLCDLALPRIGVITNVGTVHAERAGSQEVIARGKAELVQSLPADGFAVLNYDDPWVREMASQTQASVLFYAVDPPDPDSLYPAAQDFSASPMVSTGGSLSEETPPGGTLGKTGVGSRGEGLWADAIEGLGLEGIRFRLHYRREVLHLRVPLIGRHSVHTVLRAAAVGLVDGLTWQEIVTGLRSATMQLRLIAVRTESGALILDDTYNASPESMLAALNLLDELDGRKVAVLGDMLELGQYEWRGHEMVGIRTSEVVNELVTIGERGRMIAAAACRAGLPARFITELESVEDAIDFLRPRLRAEDVVLVKGSHGMRMDRIVSALEYRT
jgi:UDP-N-acetylmuramoyl-tripeptide--D-alanyl-D-alanine ligase